MPVHLGLHGARVLAPLSESEVEGLASLGRERVVARDDAVFRDHEVVDNLYIVLEGRIQTYLTEKGQRVELGTHGAGDHFARVVLSEGGFRYASAIALVPSKVFILTSTGCAALLVRTARAKSMVPNITPVPSRLPTRVVESDVTRPPSSAGQAHIRSLSSAVAGVAHEINTPLGVIENAASFVSEQLGGAQLQALAAQPEAAETLADVAEACMLIQKNVAHAARVVQSFKKLSVGQLAEPRQQVDLVRVIQEVLNVFRAKTLSALPPGPNFRGPRPQSGQHRLILASSRLDIAVICSLEERERIWDGFPGLFSRVLLNLLTNIDHYAYPGDAPGRVEITLTRNDARPAGFRLKVRDFGSGIAASDLPHIFDPFFTTGRERGGTGLGLSMVHNLVTQGFEGSVRVTSVVGEGTTFDVEFPERAPDHAPPNASLEPRPNGEVAP